MVPDSNVAALQPSSGLTVTRVYVHAPQGKQQLCPNGVLPCVPKSGWTSVRSPKYSGCNRDVKCTILDFILAFPSFQSITYSSYFIDCSYRCILHPFKVAS